MFVLCSRIITVVLLHNALPVRYLILAPIVNLILARLFYRVARSVNLDQSRLRNIAISLIPAMSEQRASLAMPDFDSDQFLASFCEVLNARDV